MKLLFIDRSTFLDTVLDVNKPRGGMITSLFKITDYLRSIGHDVTVYSDIKHQGITRAGVLWVNQCPYESYDVIICNRGIGDGYPQIKAKHRILWTHDIPHNGFIPQPKQIRAFTVVFMSHYARDIWRTFYKTINRYVIIPNGVDKEIFKPYDYERNRLIFASAPNRGLQRLPLIYEAINTQFPIDLYAYSNLNVLHPNEAANIKPKDNDYSLEYKNCQQVGIKIHDPISQKRLARQLAQSKLMILPTEYPEICSNIILQSLSCGTPIITTGQLGSACEWIRNRKNGMLTTYQPRDYMVYHLEIVRNTLEALSNKRLYKRLQKGALKTSIYTWQQVGNLWNLLLNRLN